ncbi:MAG: Ig-like domain repeat protein, partial [Xanthomonadales bacterium]|nr:Ig-like domain repeat protein [Xanthomonadales bacterium]
MTTKPHFDFLRVLSFFIIFQVFLYSICAADAYESDVVADASKPFDFEKFTNQFEADYVEENQGISIINFVGNYDKTIDGMPNHEARQAVMHEFFRHQDDDYDFIFVFTQFEFDTGEATAFANSIFNDVEGIGKELFDYRANYSSGILQSIIDMADVNRWEFNPANRNYDALLDTVIHEFMHRWGISVKYIDANGEVSNRLLGRSNSHWSYYFNSNASVMYGSLWQEIQQGQFQTIDTRHSLSPLDLYLAGFIDRDSVADMFVIDNASQGHNTDIPPPVGTRISGEKELVSINDIIAYEGQRIPDNVNSQHEFKVKFILLKSPDDEIDTIAVANIFTLSKEFQKRFHAETHGIGIIHLNQSESILISDPEVLAYVPGTLETFDSNLAKSFILSKGNSWWADRKSSKVRDTIAVIKALQLLVQEYPELSGELDSAILWINNYQWENQDEVAWMLSSGVLNSEKTQQLLDEIYSNEGNTGGWGLKSNENSSVYDTILILDTLAQVQDDELNLSAETAQFILNNINEDSGSAYVSGGESSLVSSAILLKHIDKLTSSIQIKDGLIQFILSKKNPDNTFGNGTAYETAIAIIALKSLGDDSYQPQINFSKSALGRMQSVDGSVQGSIYSTALAISLISENSLANLLFADSEISSAEITAGEQITINYTIENNGNDIAENIEVSVYKNSIDTGNLLQNIIIPSLPISEQVENEIIIPTESFSGTIDLLIVIDANNDINEFNEVDNIHSFTIHSRDVDDTPELVFDRSDFHISPTQFDSLPIDIVSNITISNLSAVELNNVEVSLSLQEIDSSYTILEAQTVNLPPLSKQQLIFNHQVLQTTTDIQLLYKIDPENAIGEQNEQNNSHVFTIEKISTVDLEVNNEGIAVPSQIMAGESYDIAFHFINRGTESSSSFDIRVYADGNNESQLIHQSQVAELAAGGQNSRSVSWQPSSEGDYELRFILDENNNVAETNILNNEVSIPVRVLVNQNTNLGIDENNTTISPDPGLQGQNLHFSIDVFNDSNQDSGEFDIKIFRQSDVGSTNVLLLNLSDNAEIPSQDSRQVEVDIDVGDLVGEHNFIIEIDPEDEIVEYNENDNLAILQHQILKLPDAQANTGSFQLTPSIPVTGENLSVTISVNNIGEQNISSLDVSLYTGNNQNNQQELVESQNIPQLLSGQSSNVVFDFIFPNDNAVDKLIVKIDENNLINEGNENNNEAILLINNQDGSLFVTNTDFSPNGDNIKDETLIVFNVDETSDYKLIIYDNNQQVIKSVESEDFLNTNYGDFLWNGKNDRGIIARDGHYTVKLENSENEVTASVVIHIDTNNSSLFESMKSADSHFSSLNCLFDSSGQLKYSNDGKYLYTSSYRNLNGELIKGLFIIKADGSSIKSILPESIYYSDSGNTRNAEIEFFSVLQNNDIFFILERKINFWTRVQEFYISESATQLIRRISPDIEDSSLRVLTVKDRFAIVDAEGLYQKIYFDGTTPKQVQDVIEDSQAIAEVSSGMIFQRSLFTYPATVSLYFLSYDYNQEPEVFLSDIEIKDNQAFIDSFYKKVSANRNFLAQDDGESVHFYFFHDFSLTKVFDKPVNSADSYGLTSYGELYIFNEDASMSLYNSSGSLLLNTEGFSSIQEFDEFLQNGFSVEVNIQDIDVYVDSSGLIDSYISQKIIDFTDSSDSKQLTFIIENQLFGTFNTPECPIFAICDNWPETVSDVKVTSLNKIITIDYDDLLSPDINVSGSISENIRLSQIQEGRSSLVRATMSTTGVDHFYDINNIESGAISFQLTENISINNSFPYLSIKDEFDNFGIWPKHRKVGIFDSFLISDLGNNTIQYNNCPIEGGTNFIYRSRDNLYADVALKNNEQVIEIRATAFDKSFKKYDIYWSSLASPASQWNLLYSSEYAPNGEIVQNWLPPASGPYSVRVTAYDNAGNQYEDTETISTTSINTPVRNIIVSPQYFSPNGDGVQDEVLIQYDVTDIAEVLVEIQDDSGLTLQTYIREHTTPAQLETIHWDGKDSNGNLLGDGEYKIIVNGINFEVTLDTKAIEAELISGLYGSTYGEFLSLLSEIVLPTRDEIEEQIGTQDYHSHITQIYDEQSEQWQNTQSMENILLDSENLTSSFNSRYRLKVTDKAGNIGYSEIQHPEEIQYRKVGLLKKNEDLNETEEIRFLYRKNKVETANNADESENSFVVDWSTGDKIAYVIQALDYEDIEFIKFKTRYQNGNDIIESESRLVNMLSRTEAADYLRDKYAGDNSNIHNFVDIFVDTGANERKMPVFMIELDKIDFPDTRGYIEVFFEIKKLSRTVHLQSKVKFVSTGNNLKFKNLTFDSILDLQGLPEIAEEAYTNLLMNVRETKGFEYYWVFEEGNNINYLNSSLIRRTSENGNIQSTDMFSEYYIDLTDSYSSRIYALPKPECQVQQQVYWRAETDIGDVIESDVLFSENVFCIEPEMEASFYLGEFCSNNDPGNSPIQFDIKVENIPPESSQLVLIELYNEYDQQLVFSDTNPQIQYDENNNGNYHSVASFNTSLLPNGNYDFRLVTTDQNGNSKSVFERVIINHEPTTNWISYPQPGTKICGNDQIAINAGISNSLGYSSEIYLLTEHSVYGDTLIHQNYRSFDKLSTTGSPVYLSDDFSISSMDGQATLILETHNSSGISYCSSIDIHIDSIVNTTIAINEAFDSELLIFSPNSDNQFDTLGLLNMEAHERLDIQLDLFDINNEEPQFVGILSANTLDVNQVVEFIWDGTFQGNTVVDGEYRIDISITDECGNNQINKFPITIDTTPPVVEFLSPIDGENLNAIQRIAVVINELHPGFNLESRLKVEFLYNGTWNEIDENKQLSYDGSQQVYILQLDWNTTSLPPGSYPLRITSEDVVGNISATQITPVIQEQQNIFWSFSVIPTYISPNADNVKDKTTITFGLNTHSSISVDIFDGQGNRVRNLTDNQQFTPQQHLIEFDGFDDDLNVLPDGTYIVTISATETNNPANTYSLNLEFIVDNSLPQVQWINPDSQIIKNTGFASVSLTESHLLDMQVTNQKLNPSGPEVTVLSTTTTGVFDLLTLESLEETQYQLVAHAQDLAGNTTYNTISYTIDKTPPLINLISPVANSVIGGDSAIVNVTGEITDTNFDYYDISIAPVSNNPVWQTIHTGTELADSGFNIEQSLAVNDGLYLIRLTAYDKAGWQSEQTVEVILDTTAPVSLISQPSNNSTIAANSQVLGTATDDNLDFYTLSYKLSGTTEWKIINIGQTSISSEQLGLISSTLESGDYLIKLSVQDKVGLISNSEISITIDNTPPPSPTNLTAQIVNSNQVLLQWDSVNSQDFAGYIIHRNGERLNQIIFDQTQYTDINLTDGEYIYQVFAQDNAGNISQPDNSVSITIDTTPPTVFIITPANEQRVNRVIDITGNATSLLDFKQFDLYYRNINNAAPGTLITHSPVPVNYGLLGTLDTTFLAQNQQYIIRLEARDNHDNISVDEKIIYVDNVAPAVVLNLTAELQGENSVLLQWTANSETDLAGYLVLQNGVVISGNGTGEISIGNAITDTSLMVENLNDGEHTFHLIAIDITGNYSSLSIPVQQTINTRVPDTIISSPHDGRKFESPILFSATSNDLDIAEISFSYSTDNTNWVLLATDTTEPFQTTLNPVSLGLNYGNIYLQAIATDYSSQTDSTPARITTEYTDITAPEPVNNITASVDGGDINLNWDANSENDLQGYNITRIFNGQSILLTSTPITDTAYLDTNLADGEYSYKIVAIDDFDNSSDATTMSGLQVFSINLNQPFSPILTPQQTQLSGSSVTKEGYIQLVLQNTNGNTALPDMLLTDTYGFNSLPIDLIPDLNILSATHIKENGDKSKIQTINIEQSPVPLIPLNFQVNSVDFTSELSWDAPDTATFGYLPYRNSTPIYPISRVMSGISYQTSSNDYADDRVSDEDPQTVWSPSYSDITDYNPTFIELTFDDKKWITSVEFHWYEDFEQNIYSPSSFQLQYHSSVGWVTIEEIENINQAVIPVTTDKPYLTDKARLLITTPEGVYESIALSEFVVNYQELATTESVSLNETDGIYSYHVTSINNYGFESLASSTVEVSIGDVEPPVEVTLTGQVSGINDVTLNWSSSSSADTAGYWIFRNGQLLIAIDNEQVFNYTDSNLPNGEYTYYIKVVDTAGNLSPASNSYLAQIQQQQLPGIENLVIQAPVSGGSLVLNWDESQSPRFNSYKVYRSLSSSTGYNHIADTTQATYNDQNVENGTRYYFVVTMSDSSGNESPYSNEVSAIPSDLLPPEVPVILSPTTNGNPITIDTNIATIAGTAEPGTNVDLFVNNVYSGSLLTESDYTINRISINGFMFQTAFSDKGDWFAYYDFENLYIKNIITNELKSERLETLNFKWNKEGTHIYVIYYDDDLGGESLAKFDTDLTQTTLLNEDTLSSAVPSPDEQLILYQGESYNPDTGISTEGLWLFDVQSSTKTEIVLSETIATNNMQISWSDNGDYVAFINDAGDSPLYLYDINTQVLTTIATGFEYSSSLTFANGSTQLIYERENLIYQYDISTQNIVELSLPGYNLNSVDMSPNSNHISYKQGCCDIIIYNPETQSTQNIYSSNSDLGQINWNENHGILAVENNSVIKFGFPGSFVFADTMLNSGENHIYVTATDDNNNTSLPSAEILINVEITELADIQLESRNIIISPETALSGTQFVASATVRNSGAIPAMATKLNVFLTNPEGVTLEVIPDRNMVDLQPGEAQSIYMDLGNIVMHGTYILQISADSENSIPENQENNNTAYKTFNVLENNEPTLLLSLAPHQVASQQPVSIFLQLFNPLLEFNGQINLAIKDEQGFPVKIYEPYQINNLLYNQSIEIETDWQTSDIFSGTYIVVANLQDASGNRISEQEEHIIVSSYAEFELAVQIQQNLITQGDNLQFSTAIDYTSGNTTQSGNLIWQVIDSNQQIIHTETRTMPTMTSGFNAIINDFWFAQETGNYQLKIELITNDYQQILTLPFTVLAEEQIPAISGEIQAVTDIILGNDFNIHYRLSNTGNTNLTNIPVTLKLLSTDLQSEIIVQTENVSLSAGQTIEEYMQLPSQNLNAETYILAIYADLSQSGNNPSQLLDTQLIQALDVTGPVIEVISPLAGSIKPANMSILFIVTDINGTVESVEMHSTENITGLPNNFNVNNINNQYEHTVYNLDEGNNQIIITATDNFGNTTEKTLSFIVDSTSPSIEITGAEESRLYNHAVTTEVIISDTNLISSEILLNSSVISATHDITEEGNYFLMARAEDSAGNISIESINFGIDLTAPQININFPVNGSETQHQQTDIHGTTEPGSTVVLTISGYQVNTQAGTDGSFDFYDVPLQRGNNEINLQATDDAGNQSPNSVIE